jgi:hypothetical protein
MIAAPKTDLSVCAHNKDREYTPVCTVVGKKVASIKEQIIYFISWKLYANKPNIS